MSHWKHASRKAGLGAAAALALLAGTTAVNASSTSAAIDPLLVDGRDFSGVRFNRDAAQQGPVILEAARAHVWREGSAQRLLLRGGTTITLGNVSLDAHRAAVWLEQVEPGLWQVFAFLEDVGTPGADAAVSLTAQTLPVEGLIRTEDLVLRVDVRERGKPSSEFLTSAERALAFRLRSAIGGAEWESIERAVQGEADPVPPPAPPEARPTLAPSEREALSQRRRQAAEDPSAEPIFRSTGTVSIGTGELAIVPIDGQNAVLVTGGVTLQYWDRLSSAMLQLRAERAVVFLAAGPNPAGTEFAADSVEGIYLEGGVVATDGSYTLRGPRMYYDLASNRALALDSVFWSYDRRIGMPLYLRADAIRQTATGSFSAEGARLANTSFFRPHFALGASDVTITRRPDEADPEGGVRTLVDARNITVQGGGVPFLYWPRFTGDPENIPLRDVSFSSSNGSGQGLTTAWSTWSLLGIDAPDGADGETLIDYYSDRGAGLGQQLSWDKPESKGELFAYWVPDDRGDDVMATGVELANVGRSRGLVVGEHRWSLDDNWSAQIEVGYVSDERLTQALFRDIARRGRELTNRFSLQHVREYKGFTAEASVLAGDFVPNEYLLQSRGYSVDRYPEAAGYLIGKDILDDVAPGLLTYYGESRVSQMAMRFVEPDVASFGFTRNRLSQDAFGVAPNQSIADRLRAEGLSERPVTRLDSRHELTAQLSAGPFEITPQLVGRITAWDDRFENFSPNERDQLRLWGAGGVTVSTATHRIYDGVDSRLLDLHRLRHTIEPSISVWHAGTTVDRVDLPVYDESVEGIAEGTIVTASLDQSFQTKRGGPGRWRNEDVFTLQSSLTWSSADADEKSPFGRYFDYRPELSNPGQFMTHRAAWKPTNAVAVVGESVSDLNDAVQITSAAGLRFQHSPQTTSTLELRYLNPLDSTRLNFSSAYELGLKYSGAIGLSYDTDRSDFQTIRSTVERRFPNVVLQGAVSYNNTTGETSFGFSFSPRVPGQNRTGISAASGGRRRAIGPLR